MIESHLRYLSGRLCQLQVGLTAPGSGQDESSGLVWTRRRIFGPFCGNFHHHAFGISGFWRRLGVAQMCSTAEDNDDDNSNNKNSNDDARLRQSVNKFKPMEQIFKNPGTFQVTDQRDVSEVSL